MISVCMIVKNEAEMLPRALANLSGFWDELIIVDTGSEDDTVAIAEAHGATVLHYDWQWPGHKGAARNVGLDAATQEWIVVLDADEIIQEPDGLRAWLATLEHEITGVLVTFENYADDGAVSLRWLQQRIWRNGAYRYVHREHEYPQAIDGARGREVGCTFVFGHRPPPDRAAPKVNTMLERLKLDVQERPDDPHSLYFLHRQYMNAEQWQNALDLGERYLATGAGLRTACYGNMSYCNWQLGNVPDALAWLHRALSDEPQRRYWWVRIADIHMAQGEWNTALAYLRGAGEVWQQHDCEREPQYEQGHWSEMIATCQTEIARNYGR